ncbi:hypothetical protein MKX03_020192 [Papaver bracteatum]|nr:hypothetical protein MKX03_020192 [Papaver bracteatum]
MGTVHTDELYGISLRGNVCDLTKWREKNPNLPLNQKFTAYRRTPLHIAAMCGHVKFAEKLCYFNKELAKEIDTHGCTPLHLASARPSLSMVKKLLGANEDVCIVKDEDGRTPIYLAVMEDRYKIIEELIKKKPEAIHIRYAQNETILHLCVKHDSLKSLKLFLAEDLQPGNAQSTNIDVNSQDDDGNTILHLAADMKKVECIKFLVESKNSRIDMNVLNKNKIKALHMLTPKQRDTFHIDSSHFKKPEKIHKEWLKERVSALMVVATLIAGIAFQAATNPPGGVFQDDSYLNSSEHPVTFTYYLGSVDGSSMSTRFGKYLSSLINVQPNDIHTMVKAQQYTNQSQNSTMIMKTATFVRHMLETLKNGSYASGNSYVESKSPGIVLKHEKWKPILSEHDRNANFTPYLIRYAGTPILAYAHPRIFFVYIICNAIAFLISVSIIMIVISGPVYEHSIHQQVKVLAWMLFFSITAWIGSYIAVFISMSPPFYKNSSILSKSSYWCLIILSAFIIGYLICQKLKYWKQMVMLHILRKEVLIDQLHKEKNELFQRILRPFVFRYLAVFYLFGLSPFLLYTIFD